MGSRGKKKKKQDSDSGIGQALLQECLIIVSTVYLAVVFVLMPLYIKDHYLEMAFSKWKIYLFSTLAFLGIVLVCAVCCGVGALGKAKSAAGRQAQEKAGKGQTRPGKEQARPEKELARPGKELAAPKALGVGGIRGLLSPAEGAAALYAVSCLVTMAVCGYPRAAWLGTDSWYMGVLAQLLFVGTFLAFARLEAAADAFVWMNAIASGACFLIGICQRAGWDVLHLYHGMPDEVVRDYLSTIGNRTWYSAYLSVVFPLGVYLFWRGGEKRKTIPAGIYTLLAFSALVTVNSDSIYAAAAVVLFALFLMSIDSPEKLRRFCYVAVLWFAACFLMSAARMIRPDRVRLLRGLSKIFLDMKWAAGGLIISLGAAAGVSYAIRQKRLPREFAQKTCGKLRRSLLAGVCGAVCLLIVLIVCNTTGVWEACFGKGIHIPYLMFDDAWGDDRGFNWKMTLQMFGDLPWIRKLFGVGSDCYAFYAYSVPQYAEKLIWYFGDSLVVTNAHNEWLNALFCQGIVGAAAYLGMFVLVLKSCFAPRESERANSLLPAIGLCVLGYMFHNVFCYQQICATGPVFILMGMAAGLAREPKRN